LAISLSYITPPPSAAATRFDSQAPSHVTHRADAKGSGGTHKVSMYIRSSRLQCFTVRSYDEEKSWYVPSLNVRPCAHARTPTSRRIGLSMRAA
jgi:hypothetical protein